MISVNPSPDALQTLSLPKAAAGRAERGRSRAGGEVGEERGRAGRCVGGLAPASQLAPFGSPQPDAVAGSEAPRRLVLQPGHRGELQRAAEGSQGHRSGRNQGGAQAAARCRRLHSRCPGCLRSSARGGRRGGQQRGQSPRRGRLCRALPAVPTAGGLRSTSRSWLNGA